MKKQGLVKLTKKRFTWRARRFLHDPWLPVKKAVLTHAHADHTYRGNLDYLVPEEGKRLSRIRLGDEARISTQKYGETADINDVKVSFHPAGHVLGSAQVRVEYKGEIWVVSGDYKLMPDATCAPFEPVKCHHFITEATFGLPIYRWQPTEFVFEEINNWWRRNGKKKRFRDFRLSLGKSQRIMNGLTVR